MATYSRQTRIDAPLESVWDFHSQISGLEALTPSWMNLEIESVTGPDGTTNPDVLVAGSIIKMSMRPLGITPQQQWTSAITARKAGDGTAMFRDEMRGGPFSTWVHTHRFFADGTTTILHDEVRYEFPGGFLGDILSTFGVIGFEPMFRDRHQTTKKQLE
jgi:ligand-binding SRPBCC domain-containing protein